MPTWRVRIPARDILITTAQIEANPMFQGNLEDRGGPGPSGDLLRERILMDTYIIRDRLDDFLAWELGQRGQSENWKLRGALITAFTGTGSITATAGPAEFRDTTGPFTAASNPEGKVIFIPGGQGSGLNPARGHYIITSRVNNQRVNVEGEFPITTALDSLDWELHEATGYDAIAILDSSA